jgi:1-acyl-sn-glycerol-3-phosphate acyltransferase
MSNLYCIYNQSALYFQSWVINGMDMNQPVSSVIAKQRYNRAKRVLKPFFIPFDHYVTYLGLKNIVKEGPNLIIANHPGIGRDIAAVITAYERKLNILAAHYLFDENIFMQEHIKPALGPRLFQFMYPIAKRFAHFLAKSMQEQEMIPINKEYKGNLVTLAHNIRNAIKYVKNYLLKGRAVVIFQIPYNILKAIRQKKIVDKEPSRYHSYMPQFTPTFGKIAWELYHEHDLIVPITPIGIHGAEGLNPFHKMVINIGKPMDITCCLDENSPQNSVTKFTARLEQRIAGLLQESGLPAPMEL